MQELCHHLLLKNSLTIIVITNLQECTKMTDLALGTNTQEGGKIPTP